LLCVLLLAACSKGSAVSEPVSEAEVPLEIAPVDTAPPAQEEKQISLSFATDAQVTAVPMTPAPTAEPTAVPTIEPTPEPTDTPVPMLGVLDGKFADKFVTGSPVLTDTSYQSERVAIFITRVVDDSKTIADHTFNYFMADVYLQNMEDLRSAPAKSWEKKWDSGQDWLKNIAKANDAIFAVSGDFTLTRKQGLVTRNGEVLRAEHDPKYDVGVIYLDGHMETFTAQDTPVAELTSDPNVWQILGFGPELLDKDGQPKTSFNDPKSVSPANIRNAVGYFEPGHYCFVYVPPYLGPKDKKPKDDSCIELEGLSKLMYSLGCVRAYNLDGGATAGMYFNGKQVIGGSLGQGRKNHDIYYIPQA
jgi:exopolysaccharide biosynthesis protein